MQGRRWPVTGTAACTSWKLFNAAVHWVDRLPDCRHVWNNQPITLIVLPQFRPIDSEPLSHRHSALQIGRVNIIFALLLYGRPLFFALYCVLFISHLLAHNVRLCSPALELVDFYVEARWFLRWSSLMLAGSHWYLLVVWFSLMLIGLLSDVPGYLLLSGAHWSLMLDVLPFCKIFRARKSGEHLHQIAWGICAKIVLVDFEILMRQL